MAIHLYHPQVILYWIELVISVVCVALAGRGYHETYIQYLITISAAFSLGNIVFLIIYGFATSRPKGGRSITKIVEAAYHLCAVLLYIIALGCIALPAEYLEPFKGPTTVFISLNIGSYLFGSWVALTECIFPEREAHSNIIEKKNTQVKVITTTTLTTTTDDTTGL